MVFLAAIRTRFCCPSSYHFRNGQIIRSSSTLDGCNSKELDTATKLKIEEKWSSDVMNNVGFERGRSKNNAYICSMFPYPSGNLHLGHVRVYAISDAIARFQRLRGKNVLHPIGFDSFGLPAENAAFENKIDPEEWTKQNITRMRKQLRRLGCSFDWNRELTTSDPSYYKFTQYLFLLMHKQGLVYRKKAWVNWDPVDKTVLADEQVDQNGRSWRSGAIVEKKMLNQWFIRTTNFAESLRSGLEHEDASEWRDIVKLQKHWIGDCNGAEFTFQFHLNGKWLSNENIWTETPEHISLVKFVALSDPRDLGISDSDAKHLTATNPFTNETLPVIIVNKEDHSYPDGCCLKLGLPSQNEEDADIARQWNIAFSPNRASDNFDERLRICQLAQISRIGGHFKSSGLKDWLISRQRRWGTPIPMMHCSSCGTVPVKFEDLPVTLDMCATQSQVSCPKCGQNATREADTMDTFVDSSWYYLRYIDPFNEKLPFDSEQVQNVMPVDVYIGGKEHATLHLYYARFVTHFLHSIGLLPCSEPFKRLLVQGMVMGKTYYDKKTNEVIKPADVIDKDGKLSKAKSGETVIMKWEKMSKSKHNGVEPTDLFDKYGVDTTRLLILGDVAPTSDRLWKEEGHGGILNFQERTWSLMNSFLEARLKVNGYSKEVNKSNDLESYLYQVRNDHVKYVTFNYNQTYQLSVAITKMQSLVKLLRKCDHETMALSLEFQKTLGTLLIMLAPMAPHFVSELWFKYQSAPNRLQDLSSPILWDKTIWNQTWPQLDDDALLEVYLKVNNAVKNKVKVSYDHMKRMTKEEALKMALSDDKVLNFIGGREILDTDYSTCEGYSAILNIVVDHRQTGDKLKANAC